MQSWHRLCVRRGGERGWGHSGLISDYSQVDMLGVRCTSVSFGAGKSPGSIDRDRARRPCEATERVVALDRWLRCRDVVGILKRENASAAGCR